MLALPDAEALLLALPDAEPLLLALPEAETLLLALPETEALTLTLRYEPLMDDDRVREEVDTAADELLAATEL